MVWAADSGLSGSLSLLATFCWLKWYADQLGEKPVPGLKLNVNQLMGKNKENFHIQTPLYTPLNG